MAISLSFCSLAVSCARDQTLDERLDLVTKPHRFSIVNWELGAFCDGVRKTFTGGHNAPDAEAREEPRPATHPHEAGTVDGGAPTAPWAEARCPLLERLCIRGAVR